MEEGVKNKLILILSILLVVFFISSISSCQDSQRHKNLVNQERQTRMELEERTLVLSKQNEELDKKINQLQQMFNQKETTHQATTEVLNQEITRLKDELEKMTKLKERLEEDLKELLVSSKK